MKALTLWQPWASLMAFEEKKIETRCWSTKFRGEIAIHAAAKEPADWLGTSRHRAEFHERFYVLSEKHNWGEGYWPNANHIVGLGSVLCIVRLLGIEPTERVRDELTEQELCFGNYEDGRYAWFTEMIERFDKPIPAKGNRMLWNWAYDPAKNLSADTVIGSGDLGRTAWNTQPILKDRKLKGHHESLEHHDLFDR